MIKFGNFLKYDYKTRLVFFCLALGTLLLGIIFYSQYFRPHLLKVSFYNIGQGDAIFIETPSRFQMLVDAGPGPKILEELSRDLPFYDRSLNLIVPTHADSDHVSGMIDVLERYSIDTIMLDPHLGKTTVYDRLMESVKQEGARIFYAGRSQDSKQLQPIALPGGVTFKILNPVVGYPEKTTNDDSIALLVEYGAFKLLLLADVTARIEDQLLPLLPSGIQVVKIAHHGSRFSSGQQFLQTLAPQLCVVQVGKNRYGHPSKEALASIQSAHCHLWRTDTMGALTLYSDGKTYWIK